MLKPAQTASSPSSPKRRHLGFLPSTDSPSSSIPSLYQKRGRAEDVEGMEGVEEMEDIWAVLGERKVDGGRDVMDCDFQSQGAKDPLTEERSTMSPFAAYSVEKGRVASSIGESVSSKKTTSESASESSAATAATSTASSKGQQESPPLSTSNTEMNDDSAAGMSHSMDNTTIDTIDQMLGYMRACNSHSQPLTDLPATTRNMARSDSREWARRTENSDHRNAKVRKQLSPVQKVTRSLSHGGCGGGSAVEGGDEKATAGGRLRAASLQRAKNHRALVSGPVQTLSSSLDSHQIAPFDDDDDDDTTILSGLDQMVKHLQSDSHDHSQVQRQHQQQQHGVESCSPNLSSIPTWLDGHHAPPSAPISTASSSSQKGRDEMLSLEEFLKRPEGAAWVDHFSGRSPESSKSPSIMFATQHHQHQQQSVPVPNLLPMAAINAGLPTQVDVASVLGMQQAPNQELVQAFQNAFILGLQQLGIGDQGMFRQGQYHQQSIVQPQAQQQAHVPHHLSTPIPPPQQQQHIHHHAVTAPFAWTPQEAKHTSQDERTQRSVEDTAGDAYINGPPAENGSAILESLLHDINQHRPDQEEFSLNEFLTFVANTVEHPGEEIIFGAKFQHGRVSPKFKAADMKKSAVQSQSAPGRDDKSTKKVAEKRTRNRTTSISGQLIKTHLNDVIEDVTGEERRQESSHEAANEGLRRNSKRKDLAADVEEDDEEEEGEREDRHGPREGKDEEGEERKKNDTTTILGSPPSSLDACSTREKERNKVAERRRRRRESHNAVERRRRDNINERIAELASLLPESMLLDAIAASTAGGTTPHIDLSLFTRKPFPSTIEHSIDRDGNEDPLTHDVATQEQNQTELERKALALAPVSSGSETLALAQSKPNKGIILSKSVDYIKHLHEFCSILRTKNKELQQEMDDMKDAMMIAGSSSFYHRKNKHTDGALRSALASTDGHDGDLPMQTATPPPNLATWWSQHRVRRDDTDEEKLASAFALDGTSRT
ncbi:hypothetical protein CBS101457_003961 [Exobasidium rhododendri]|nr:hypothetical protein CBS101457_003961 [Exobasidium rhododendri]